MNRILVLGICGAGKSTLNRKLGEILGLPVVHLDYHYWKPGWVEPPLEEWRKTVEPLAKAEQWIMDGNYTNTIDMRLPLADLIIYLDFPRWFALYRVIKRWWTYRKGERPDLISGCDEKLELEFLRFVWDFNGTHRPKIMQLIKDYGKEDSLVVLSSVKEIEKFVAGIENKYGDTL